MKMHEQHKPSVDEDGAGIESLLVERERLDQELEEARQPVTVLYSDIVGYTSFVKRHGDAEGRLFMHLHKQWLLPLITRNNGVYVKSIGDAMMARFSQPSQAVQAACLFLRDLAAENQDRDPKQRLHVRIGIASGRALIEPGDVNGHVVNVSARLCKQAREDGILICESTFEALDAYLSGCCIPEPALHVRGLETEALRAYRVIWDERAPLRYASPSEDFLVLEASLEGERLKLSLHPGGVGQETISSYEEIQLNLQVVENSCKDIREGFRNATFNSGGKHLDLLRSAGSALFDVLLTGDLKSRLARASTRYLVLQIQDSLVDIPWELLHDGEDFLCRKFAIGRRVLSREKPAETNRPPVFRPRTSILSSSSPDLPAAAREADSLLERLASNPRISVSMRKNVTQGHLRDALKESEIVHFCGHADYVSARPDESGWRVADGKWTATDVRQMAEGKAFFPFVVFANACQSGRTEDWVRKEQSNLFGLARAYLLAGVQHYIGTFSDIQDAPSEVFAAEFYDALLTGLPIGMALREARAKLSESSAHGSLIWASYVLYGDPTARVFAVPDVQTPDNRDDETLWESGGGTSNSSVRKEGAFRESRQGEETPGEQIERHRRRTGFSLAVGITVLVLAVLGVISWFQLGQEQTVDKPPADHRLALLEELSERTTSPDYQKRLQAQDDWTSRQLTLALLPFQTEELDSDDVQIAEALRSELERKMSSVPGVQVLEREQLEQIFEEQNVGSSTVADPSTMARLGQLRFSRFLFSGKLFSRPDGGIDLSFRLCDCETTETVAVDIVGGASSAEEISERVARDVTRNLQSEYPERGRLLDVKGDRVYLNIGSGIGLQEGLRFCVFKQPATKSQKAFDLMREVAAGSILEVAPGAALGRIDSASTNLAEGMRVEIRRVPE